MTALARTPATAAWAVLMALTLISWFVGSDHGDGASAARVASVVVLVVAFAKVEAVGMYFMELREAPLVLRTIFTAWCVLVCGALIGMYLIA